MSWSARIFPKLSKGRTGKKEPVVLDTSLFVNPASALVFGPDPTQALTRFLSLASAASGVEFLMPPSVYSELMYFAEEPRIPKSLLLHLHKQPPKKHEIRVPGFLLYELVEAMRDRIDRGLRLAERHVRDIVHSPVPAAKRAGDKVNPEAEVIGRLRESYRRIMREGMLDSRADVDLLLLAYETKGTLVSADQGVVAWAENLGVRILPHDHLLDFLKKKGA